MKQKGSILPIVGIIFLVLTVGAGAYYLGATNHNQINQIPTYKKNVPVQTNTEVKDENTKWKTYTSSCGFSLKYPDSWNAQKYFILDSIDSCTFLTAPDYKQYMGDREGFSLTIDRIAKGSIQMGITINSIEDYVRSLEAIVQPTVPVVNKTTIQYGSLNGVQFDFSAKESTTNFVTSQGNYFYIITWPSVEQYSGPYRINTNQILSTFEFLK